MLSMMNSHASYAITQFDDHDMLPYISMHCWLALIVIISLHVQEDMLCMTEKYCNVVLVN